MNQDIDARIEAMSEAELDTFLDSILTEPDMVQTALEVSVKVLVEFVSRNGLDDQLVSEIAPNEMVALIVATQTVTGVTGKRADNG